MKELLVAKIKNKNQLQYSDPVLKQMLLTPGNPKYFGANQCFLMATHSLLFRRNKIA